MSSLNYVVHQLQELGLAAEAKGETVYCEDIDLDFDRSHDGVRGISRWLVETREEYAEVIRELHESPPEEEAATWSEEEQRAQADLELMEIALEEELLANEAAEPEEPWSYEEAMGHGQGYNPDQPLSDESLEAEEAYITEEEPVTDTQIEKAQDEAESYSEDAPCHTQAGDRGEEIKPHFFGSPLDALQSPKEVAQATEVDDQDRGGVPNPEDYKRVAAAVVVLVKGQRFIAPEGWKIKESRPSGKVVWYGSVYQDRKAKNEARGATFSLVCDL